MTPDDDPVTVIDAACATLCDSLVRRFSCACCRRVWHLIDDERVWRAIEVAERHAVADGDLEELDNARSQVSAAIKERAREEWEAEAEAHFHFTPSYCEIAARLYATMAAWYTLSRNMFNPDPDPHMARPDRRKQSSWFWAASAVESVARSEALRRRESVGLGDGTKSTSVESTVWLLRIKEHHEQLQIIRRMVSESGSARRPGRGGASLTR